MTLADLLPDLKLLEKSEKLQLIQLLAAEIVKDQQQELTLPSEPVAIWSPHDSPQAAADLLAFLESQAANN